MFAETLKNGDRIQISEIDNRYNYLLHEKFSIMERMEQLKANGRQFSSLTLEIQKLTDELIRLDETRTQIVML